MAVRLNLLAFGSVSLQSGFPPHLAAYRLPHAEASYVAGAFGIICVQEIITPKILLRHFLLRVKGEVSLQVEETGQPIQSLLGIEGNFRHQVQGLAPVAIKEKEYLFYSTAGNQMTITSTATGNSSLLNVQYPPATYKEFTSLFQAFKSDLKKAFRQPLYFAFQPRTARYTVHDAVNALWLDKYAAHLQHKHVELRLETSLLALLAQTYSSPRPAHASLLEQQLAAAAHEMILRDIRKHLTPEEIAASLFCTDSWLKKAFHKVYGVGMFHFLRQTRMEKARALLLKGDSLKSVAIEVSMKPRNFPKEFKAYFGYTVTALKRGEV